ncbi:hypothetical protein EJB05_19253, partial [Eragrostis curvula]
MPSALSKKCGTTNHCALATFCENYRTLRFPNTRQIKQVSEHHEARFPASRARSLRPKKAAGGGDAVPAGHVPVCVGEEGGAIERFTVRAELLGAPDFAPLLLLAAEEYGYAYHGELRIPCTVTEFRRILLRLSDAA